MQKIIDSHRSRAWPLGIATVITAVVIAGCGGSSTSATTAATAGAPTSAPGTTGGGSASAAPGAGESGPLAFARCMRANGVPSFPDPSPGGGLAFHASAAVASSPGFKAAQAKCGRLLPALGGLGGPSGSPQQQARALAQLREVAQCMRSHGISDFPDPRATRPPHLTLGQYSEITNYEGVWILFPAAIDMQAPAWVQAAAACGPLAESFNHPHH